MADGFNTLINSLAADTARTARVNNTLSAAQNKKTDEAAKDFEAVFLAEMMGPMFSTVEVDPMFGGGPAEEMYKSMIVQEHAKGLAQQGGIGLASHIKEQLIALQQGTGDSE